MGLTGFVSQSTAAEYRCAVVALVSHKCTKFLLNIDVVLLSPTQISLNTKIQDRNEKLMLKKFISYAYTKIWRCE